MRCGRCRQAVAVAVTLVALGTFPSAANTETADSPQTEDADQPDAGAAARARAAFADVYAVLSSPRCANCHPADDVPRQGDEARPHAQNISRRSAASGLPCTTCHREHNAPFPGGPPGVHDWHMPPAETPMVFVGKSPRELCEQLKSPADTGGRDLDDLIAHAARDHLVLWAWKAGPGRAPPPISHAAFVRAVTTWVREGAACPLAEP